MRLIWGVLRKNNWMHNSWRGKALRACVQGADQQESSALRARSIFKYVFAIISANKMSRAVHTHTHVTMQLVP